MREIKSNLVWVLCENVKEEWQKEKELNRILYCKS